MRRIAQTLVIVCLVTACGATPAAGGRTRHPSPKVTTATPTPISTPSNLAQLAQTLADMIARDNASGAALRLSSEQQLVPQCEITGFSGYFLHTDAIADRTTELFDTWKAKHPNGETAHAVATMKVEQEVRSADGTVGIAKAVAVALMRDCSKPAP